MKKKLVLGALIAALILALALPGCSYLFGDPYGDYLQKVEAWIDLRSGLKNASGLSLDRVNGIAVAEGTYLGNTYRYVFLKCDFNNMTSSVRSLAYNDLALSSFNETPSMSGAFAAGEAADGFIRIGDYAFQADLSMATTGLTNPPKSFWVIRDGIASNNLMYTNGSNLLSIDHYTPAWTAPFTVTWLISSVPSNWQLARAALLPDGRVCLLFFQGGGGEGMIRGVVFSNLAALNAAAALVTPELMDSPAASLSDPIHVYSPNGGMDGPSGISAWLTEDGVVSMTDERNNSFTFQRFPYAPGSAIDKYTLSANYDAQIYFEASGKYWYRFDRGTGRLYRLRTWWK